ncbi:transposase, partial [Streptomyces sp. NPDC127178]|uniref:transposase n=1 Tax=Streptomyces sp. NPDC127178 TaxID=3345385 RepID=UPI00362E3315
ERFRYHLRRPPVGGPSVTLNYRSYTTRLTVPVLADRAYSSRAIRAHLRRRGIRSVIPQQSDQVGHRLRRGRLGGRPPGFDSEAYKQRNTIERCINRLKQWRGLATRTDKLAIAYQAALHLAVILIWTRR